MGLCVQAQESIGYLTLQGQTHIQTTTQEQQNRQNMYTLFIYIHQKSYNIIIYALYSDAPPFWSFSIRTSQGSSPPPKKKTFCISIWMFPKIVVPQNIHFNKVFHYKPSILGYPYFWKHPYIYMFFLDSNLTIWEHFLETSTLFNPGPAIHAS